MKYLDPKADLTFKKIFGNHPQRLTSLLNALLPLSEEEQIHEIEYLPTELVPQVDGHKNTIVDVLCTDSRGRKFCVEMQMEWSNAFKQRVLFNASKLYVSQAMKRDQYSDLQPVYSLNLINDVFERDTPDFIHNYRIVHDKDSNKVIEGLHFTFIELPKFTPHSIA
ncbi:Rpn family recombination-promoting nuclease/putative transposase, partial [uncultured Prevotella sp.]|uniref:Rpn family recombination-promoting nuclease/putative transposase n=1 Tax=uncultured Prevotella sp. TaxID=159272 RepID=UPI0035B3970D